MSKTELRVSYLGGWCAEEDERDKGNRLIVTSRCCATNRGDGHRWNNKPQRREDRVDEMGSGGGHERREDDERDTENRNRLARPWRDAHNKTSVQPLAGSQEHLHDNFIVVLAIDLYLPR